MRSLPRRLAPLIALSTGFGFTALALAPAAHADTVTVTWYSSGTEQTFSVPPGVDTVHVVAVGGRGGTAATNSGAAGFGASLDANLRVSSYSTLYIEVGG